MYIIKKYLKTFGLSFHTISLYIENKSIDIVQNTTFVVK